MLELWRRIIAGVWCFSMLLCVWLNEVESQRQQAYILSVAELHRYIDKVWMHTHPPLNLLHFHAVFRKIWPNDRLVALLFVVGIPLWEILDLPLIIFKRHQNICCLSFYTVFYWYTITSYLFIFIYQCVVLSIWY